MLAHVGVAHADYQVGATSQVAPIASVSTRSESGVRRATVTTATVSAEEAQQELPWRVDVVATHDNSLFASTLRRFGECVETVTDLLVCQLKLTFTIQMRACVGESLDTARVRRH